MAGNNTFHSFLPARMDSEIKATKTAPQTVSSFDEIPVSDFDFGAADLSVEARERFLLVCFFFVPIVEPPYTGRKNRCRFSFALKSDETFSVPVQVEKAPQTQNQTNMPSRDIEGNAATTVNNPYSSQTPSSLGAYHPITLLKRCLYMSISGYVLIRYFNLYNVILQSPHVRHQWFKVALALNVALLTVKAYVEVFEGRVRKSKVNYDNFKQTTHLTILLFVLTAVAYHYALWPHYHANTPIILGILFFGLLLQLMLVLPSWLQNLLSLVGLTVFLQQYQ